MLIVRTPVIAPTSPSSTELDPCRSYDTIASSSLAASQNKRSLEGSGAPCYEPRKGLRQSLVDSDTQNCQVSYEIDLDRQDSISLQDLLNGQDAPSVSFASDLTRRTSESDSQTPTTMKFHDRTLNSLSGLGGNGPNVSNRALRKTYICQRSFPKVPINEACDAKRSCEHIRAR